MEDLQEALADLQRLQTDLRNEMRKTTIQRRSYRRHNPGYLNPKIPCPATHYAPLSPLSVAEAPACENPYVLIQQLIKASRLHSLPMKSFL
jgi:hypothetical protein